MQVQHAFLRHIGDRPSNASVHGSLMSIDITIHSVHRPKAYILSYSESYQGCQVDSKTNISLRLYIARDLPCLRHIADIAKKTTMAPKDFNLLSATAKDIRKLYDNEDLTTAELLRIVLRQITSHNLFGAKLGAMICLAPMSTLRLRAAILDHERTKDRPRGPLHGIPVIVHASTLQLVRSGIRSGAYSLGRTPSTRIPRAAWIQQLEALLLSEPGREGLRLL